MRVFFIAAAALAAGAGGLAAGGQANGLYTEAQADRGAGLYADQCASCHGGLRAFVPEMAALLGDHTFRNRWNGRSLGELFALIRDEMPQDAPGTLSPDETASLVAHVLRGNRFPPGDAALPNDVETLNAIPFAP